MLSLVISHRWPADVSLIWQELRFQHRWEHWRMFCHPLSMQMHNWIENRSPWASVRSSPSVLVPSSCACLISNRISHSTIPCSLIVRIPVNLLLHPSSVVPDVRSIVTESDQCSHFLPHSRVHLSPLHGIMSSTGETNDTRSQKQERLIQYERKVSPAKSDSDDDLNVSHLGQTVRCWSRALRKPFVRWKPRSRIRMLICLFFSSN